MKHMMLFTLATSFISISTHLNAQWSEHPVPVGFPVSSLGFAGDQVFAAWFTPESAVVGGAVKSSAIDPWTTVDLPADTLCPGGICKPKYLDSENGRLYYVNPGWPGFLYQSEDAGQNWTEVLPFFTELDEAFFSGDRIFYTLSNVLWMYDPAVGQWVQSFASGVNWDIGGLCDWGDKLLLIDGAGVYVSNDNGDSWTILSDEVNNEFKGHADTEIFGFGETLFVSIRDEGWYISNDGGAEWDLKPFPGERFIRTMAGLNGRLLAGDGVALFVSTNGQTWEKQLTAPGPNTLEVHGNTMYMGTGMGVFHSTDGGNTWITRSPGLARLFAGTRLSVENKALFSFADRLYLANEFGLYETQDDGANWRFAGCFPNIRQGLPAGNALMVRNDPDDDHYAWWISRDTAKTWQLMELPESQLGDHRKMLTYDDGRLFVFLDRTGFRSLDLGQSWSPLPVQFSGKIVSAAAANEKIFAITYPGNNLSNYLSTDYGDHWTEIEYGFNTEYTYFSDGTDVYFSDGQNYYKYGDEGFDFIPHLPTKKFKIDFWQNTLFAYQAEGNSNPEIWVSSDQGFIWMNLAEGQPFLTSKGYDRGAGAAGPHQGDFYAFGRSATQAQLPALWKIKINDPERTPRFGSVYHDFNDNDAFDFFEDGIPGLVISTSGSASAVSITDEDGNFAIIQGEVGDTIRVQNHKNFWPVTPPFYVLSEEPKSYIFKVPDPPPTFDLRVAAKAVSSFVPGRETQLVIDVRNDAYYSPNYQLYMVKPPELSINDLQPFPTAVSGDTVLWHWGWSGDNANNLLRVYFGTPLSVQVGTPLNFKFWLTSLQPEIQQDAFPEDNQTTLLETVVSEKSSNSKTVNIQKLNATQAAGGEWLEYTIRVQNTSSTPTYPLLLTDTLSELLDLQSFQVQILPPYINYAIWPGGILTLNSNFYYLADSASSDAWSRGVFSFIIRTRPNLQPGDTIFNAAQLYLGNGSSVRTNTAKTWVDQTTGTVENRKSETPGWVLFPNPVGDELLIFTATPIAQQTGFLYFFDLAGRLWKQTPFSVRTSVADLPPGVYFVCWGQEGGGVLVSKLVKK